MSERHRSLVENLREFVNVDIANEYKRSKWGELSLREKLDKTEKMKGLVLGDLEEALEQVSRFFEQENSHGKILYRGENDSHVIDFLIPPYIIEADGKFYAFKGARLSMTFSGITTEPDNDALINLDSPFIVTNLLYKHPHVYPSGHLDYTLVDMSGQFRYGEEGALKFRKWYNLSKSRGSIAVGIAEVMKISQRTLERSYVDQGGLRNPWLHYHPVYLMGDCKRKIAEERQDVLEYAHLHGIPAERIFKSWLQNGHKGL